MQSLQHLQPRSLSWMLYMLFSTVKIVLILKFYYDKNVCTVYTYKTLIQMHQCCCQQRDQYATELMQYNCMKWGTEASSSYVVENIKVFHLNVFLKGQRHVSVSPTMRHATLIWWCVQKNDNNIELTYIKFLLTTHNKASFTKQGVCVFH